MYKIIDKIPEDISKENIIEEEIFYEKIALCDIVHIRDYVIDFLKELDIINLDSTDIFYETFEDTFLRYLPEHLIEKKILYFFNEENKKYIKINTFIK